MIAQHHQLIASIDETGALSEPWRSAFSEVPRHLFVPDAVWTGESSPLTPVFRQDNPQAWLDLVYSDLAISTQVDDGATAAGQPGCYPTISISKPSIVAAMLERSAVTDGAQILEIGTGTGWNAALLAARLGADHVVSVEVDAQVASQARKALADAGYGEVTVIAGDGAAGYPPRARYDRVLATAAVRQVPYAWVQQTHSGGRIVTPWGNAYHNGTLLQLDVGDDGTATGRFGGNAAFMWLRDQRIPRGWLAANVDRDNLDYEHRTATEYPDGPIGDFDGSFAVGLHLPDCQFLVSHDEDGDPFHFTVWLFHPGSGSVASLTSANEQASEFPVRQYGPRKLWNEVEAAARWWDSAGQPEHTRFGLTVTPDRQWVWLDDPHGEHTWPVSPQ